MPNGTRAFINFTKEVSGISLTESKRALIYNRLRKRLNELQIDLETYTKKCKSDPKELQHLLDLITTNHTNWMREASHFTDLVERVIPQLLQSQVGTPKLRIWCAASSSGEEPYGIAMRIREVFPDSTRWDLKILATDISQTVLETARLGIYDSSDVRMLSPQQLQILFKKADSEHVQVKDDIKRLVSYARLNLIGEWRMHGPFDVIFCRNVMIYFDDDTRCQLVNRFSKLLSSAGVLYIGHTEGLNSFAHPYTMIAPSIYELS